MSWRTRIDAKTVVAVGVALVVLLAYASVIALSRDFYGVAAPAGSTYDTSDQGLSVFTRYLAALGYEPKTLRDFSELPPEGDTLLLAGNAPFAKPPTSAEAARLDGWVKRGGRLLVAGLGPLDLVPDVGVGRGPVSVKEQTLAPLVPTVYSAGITKVRPGHRRLLVSRPQWVTHLKDLSGQALVSARHGKGEVVWLADTFALSNEGIDTADNARLAVALAVGRGGDLYIDEYHHGFAKGGSVWTRLGAGARAASILAIIAVTLLIFGKARRLGPAIDEVSTPTARTGAYIESLAELYRKAGARGHTLAALEDGLKRALARRHGTPDAGLARHPVAAEALERSSAVRERTRIDEGTFMEAAEALSRARREVEGTYE